MITQTERSHLVSMSFNRTIDEALAANERYREKRLIGDKIQAIFASPTKREMDFVISALSLLEQNGVARPLIERCCGTLEILACVESITFDGRHRQLVPLENRIERTPLRKIHRNPAAIEALLESIAFMQEPLYNRLKDEAEDFLDELKGKGSSMKSLIRKHSRPGGVLTKEGGMKEEGEDDA